MDATVYASEALQAGWISPVEVERVTAIEVPEASRVWKSWPTHVAAAEFHSKAEPDVTLVGAWAFDLLGFIVSVDGVAREYSTHGDMACADSLMAGYRNEAARIPQIAEAKALIAGRDPRPSVDEPSHFWGRFGRS